LFWTGGAYRRLDKLFLNFPKNQKNYIWFGGLEEDIYGLWYGSRFFPVSARCASVALRAAVRVRAAVSARCASVALRAAVLLRAAGTGRTPTEKKSYPCRCRYHKTV